MITMTNERYVKGQAAILDILEAEIRRILVLDSLKKKLVRHHLNKQARHGGVHL
jgi:hypothetical protein